mmetsp:Transcript_117283/g.373598  ORF Transcript_117283/g.373598 Transcript_117283/m.373598 type:complete len:211 (-) Transcript_117283:690-1322(-)
MSQATLSWLSTFGGHSFFSPSTSTVPCWRSGRNNVPDISASNSNLTMKYASDDTTCHEPQGTLEFRKRILATHGLVVALLLAIQAAIRFNSSSDSGASVGLSRSCHSPRSVWRTGSLPSGAEMKWPVAACSVWNAMSKSGVESVAVAANIIEPSSFFFTERALKTLVFVAFPVVLTLIESGLCTYSAAWCVSTFMVCFRRSCPRFRLMCP